MWFVSSIYMLERQLCRIILHGIYSLKTSLDYFWKYWHFTDWQFLEKARYAYFVHNEKCYFSTTGGIVEIRGAVRTEQIPLKHFKMRYTEVGINYSYLSP